VALVAVTLGLLAPAASRARPQAPSPVLAGGPLVWAAPVLIDGNPIDGLACPTVSLCVAVDDDGHLLSSTDPLGGGGRWQSADIDGSKSLVAVSCPSASLCAAVDAGGDAATTGDPAGGASAWAVAQVDTSIGEPSPYGGGPDLLRGVACPTVSFCVAVDSVGNAVYSGNPTAGAAAWTVAHIDDNSDYGCVGGGLACQAPLMGVSCPTASACSAVDFTGNVLESAAPGAPAPWPSRSAGGAGPQSLWSVSCPAVSFCATVDGTGGNAVTWNPAQASPLLTHRLPIDAFGIWCTSATLCLAAGEAPNGTAELVGSTDPAAKSPAWSVTDFGDVNAVSCPTSSVCLAADDEGQVMVGTTVKGLTTNLRAAALGHLPRLGVLVRHRGYALHFTSVIAGELQITWAAPGPVATVLATASARFTGPQTATVRVSLTGAGRRLLGAGGRIGVNAAATYDTNTGAVSTQRKLILSGRR